MIDLRTVAAVALTLTFTYVGLGRGLPFDSSGVLPFAASVLLFGGYLYALRTLLRLPFALVITVQRTRYAQRQYGLRGMESWREGYVRGFMDTRRWTVGPLALVDRLCVFGATLLATMPGLGSVLVTLVGLVGLTLMLVLYLVRGNFGWLVEDSLGGRIKQMANQPFIKL